MFNQHFGSEILYPGRLRRLYRDNQVTLRKLRINVALSTGTKIRRDDVLREVLPKVIKQIEDGSNILFVDEAMFTSRVK